MNIFIEYIGHLDLDYSMHLLFEKRLGHKLFRPNGSQEWADKSNLITAGYGYDPKYPVNPWHSLISWQEFLDTNFDILITTCWNNEKAMLALRDKYKPKATILLHIANAGEKPAYIKNVLLSTKTPMPRDTNWIRFIPEHRETYVLQPPVTNKIVKSYYPNMKICTAYGEPETFNYFASQLPEFTFYQHGGGGSAHGVVPGVQMPQSMNECMFVWHDNPTGCFGYLPRPALALGKPLITNIQWYRNAMTYGYEFCVDGVNCIDIDPKVRSKDAAIKILREWSKPDVYPEVSRWTSEKFKKDAPFEKEADAIKTWLERIH